MIKISKVELAAVAVGAKLYFSKQNEISHGLFEEELAIATKLKNQLYDSDWEEDTELFIEEMPF